MVVKKIENAPFHVGNKLHGPKSAAKYGVFRDGVQVGVVISSPLWSAYDMDCRRRLLTHDCGSLKQLKQALAKI